MTGPHRKQAPSSRVGADALAMRHESFLKGLLERGLVVVEQDAQQPLVRRQRPGRIELFGRTRPLGGVRLAQRHGPGSAPGWRPWTTVR